MNKFEVGEIAILWIPGDVSHKKQVEIIAVGDISNLGVPADYRIDIPGDTHPSTGYWCIDVEYLRKKEPPQVLSSWEEIEKKIGWNPEKVSA